MGDRIICCVPFCRRTCRNEKGYREWICAEHWRLVSKRTRATFQLAQRRVRKIVASRPEHREWWTYKGGSPQRLRAVAMWRRNDELWERCKREAIEGAAEI